MIGRIELRKAVPEDFKTEAFKGFTLKQNVIYYVQDINEPDKMQGCYILSQAHDFHIFKELLLAEMIYVPLEDEKLTDFLKL